MSLIRTVVITPSTNPNRVAIVQDYNSRSESCMLQVFTGCCMGAPKWDPIGGFWYCEGCSNYMSPQPLSKKDISGPQYWVGEWFDKENCTRWASKWMGLGAEDLDVNLTYDGSV